MGTGITRGWFGEGGEVEGECEGEGWKQGFGRRGEKLGVWRLAFGFGVVVFG
jgi:hypothetical protein